MSFSLLAELKFLPRRTWRERWSGVCGYREVLRIALPLVVSTSSWSVQTFVDRMFLSWYSPEAMAAALPAGLFSFTIVCFFIGTASYANTFVAQYEGAGQPHRIGPAIWQGIYFALMAAAFLPLFIPLADPIFRWVGHTPQLQALEAPYFQILMLGAAFHVYLGAAQSFYTGLGRNWPVMWVNIGITSVNLLLDNALIFGNWGMPRMGIEGAAWATVIALGAGAVAITILLFFDRDHARCHLRSGWRFDSALFGRLMRFGAPSGAQFMLDLFSFSLFIFIVGRIGIEELAATNIAFQINSLMFMPMLGFGIATSTLVGQELGANNPDGAARATWSAFHMTFGYMVAVALLCVLFPSWFISPFMAKVEPGQYDALRVMARNILFFVAIYTVCDTMNVIFASALKGAGDTRFVMWLSLGMAWTLMVVPAWVACDILGYGLYAAWLFLSLYVTALGLSFLARFLQGRWRGMRVIETPPPGSPLPARLPGVPTSEVDMPAGQQPV